MFSKPLAFGLLALGCVTAAAGGAYVATRHNAAAFQATSPATAAVPAVSAPAASVPSKPADQGVSETEAAVTPASTDAAKQDAPAPPSSTKPTVQVQAPAPRESKSAPVAAPARPKPAPAAVNDPPARTVPLPQRTTPLPDAVPPDATPSPVAVLPSPAPAGAEPATGDNTGPPQPDTIDDLVLPAASVIGLQLETGLTSERAHVEDRVEARVTRDVLVDGRLAIPAGSRVLGSVTQVDRGGKLKDRARLSIRFHTLVLANGDELSLRTEQITREGEAPAADSSRKIGGAAVGGAILGAILGGGKGAMIGGMAGAGGGTAMVMAGDRNPATFQPGTIVTARLASPVTVQVHRDR